MCTVPLFFSIFVRTNGQCTDVATSYGGREARPVDRPKFILFLSSLGDNVASHLSQRRVEKFSQFKLISSHETYRVVSWKGNFEDMERIK